MSTFRSTYETDALLLTMWVAGEHVAAISEKTGVKNVANRVAHLRKLGVNVPQRRWNKQADVAGLNALVERLLAARPA